MGTEIERKFLVSGDGWRQGAKGVLVRQGYLHADVESTIRVRVMGGQGFLTLKGRTIGIARPEYEYAIPAVDAQALLESLGARCLVEKIRHTTAYAGMKWEIDEFLNENRGLVVAEVELAAVDQTLELPPWIGPEVSHDPRYANAYLARHPFTGWGRAG